MTASAPKAPTEGLVDLGGERFYAIPDVDRLPPFLMSIVTDGDRWMFASSAGSLTAGRRDADHALFPYETDDRLHRATGYTGPVTLIRPDDPTMGDWRPFRVVGPSAGTRTLLKSVVGDQVVFTEAHPDLGLVFRYRWATSERFGFVRTVTLANTGSEPVSVEVLDGLLDLLPSGLGPSIYRNMGNLANAYKRSEVVEGRLAVYSLESPISDRPEPAEVLAATVVWSVGFPGAALSVDPAAVAGDDVARSRSLATGVPGAYLLSGTMRLDPGAEATWHIVADVDLDQAEVVRLRGHLADADDLAAEVEDAVAETTRSLVRIMGRADAAQRSGEPIADAHHVANVTYNVMRGGIPLDGYRIDTDDFADFVASRNRPVAESWSGWFDALDHVVPRAALMDAARATGDPHLTRLALEYLPFSFSRRHGDPSRPWNVFSIRVQDRDGEPILYHEGNWRDIFQNWEALCMSFPHYLPGVIAAFVNASTADGFNPYRINRDGIDWEVPEPDNPWSNIGYWGDHQLVYLVRLLEACERHLPGEVGRMLEERWFVYADVPYRLAPYDELVAAPRASIRFDDEAAARAAERSRRVGGDGRLLCDDDGSIRRASLLEKLLVPALSKLSNLVAGGGIWMNTQRPEWNDANNALAGHGLSMVTLCHLRRYLGHLRLLVDSASLRSIDLPVEIDDWLVAVTAALGHVDPATAAGDDLARRALLDDLGGPFSDYRWKLYRHGLPEAREFDPARVVELIDAAMPHLDHAIRASRRSDGLFHAYNLVDFGRDGSTAVVEHLPEMLEGQVAVIDSGLLSPEESADVVDALFASAMYRPDQQSFMLYPTRRLPSFLAKNVIPRDVVESIPLLRHLVGVGDDSLVVVDDAGAARFVAELATRGDVEGALDLLADDPDHSDAVGADREAVVAAFEQVFDHHAYTGRSGSMYGYEGIGSIYWHMVAKLLVSVQESLVAAVGIGASPETIERLAEGYRRIRHGLGFNKSASEFGAIPLDPYSHTPAHAGAQQPGMTGLVKEELLARPLELGFRVEAGELVFDPTLLATDDLLDEAGEWTYVGLDLEPTTMTLPGGSLAATVCQVPVIVSSTAEGEPGITVVRSDGTASSLPGSRLDRASSAEIFSRSGEVRRVEAKVVVRE